jgi:hypothetical protein
MANVELRQEYMGSSHQPSDLYDLFRFAIHESFIMPLPGRNGTMTDVTGTTLAGRPAYMTNYTMTVNNCTVKGTIVYTIQNSWYAGKDGSYDMYMTRYYLIEYAADEGNYSKYLDVAFHMIGSFRFT